MAPSFATGDGPDPFLRHISWPYFVLEVASNRDAFVDHVVWFNLFPLQHVVQRQGSILEALYSISEGFWFSPPELIMTSLFHFERKYIESTSVESRPFHYCF